MLLQNGMKAPVILVLAVIFTSCTTTDDIPNTNNGDETSQKWCVYFEEKQCLPATSTTCPGGGLLALACPSDYSGGGGNISSSSRNNFSLSSSSIFISSSSLSVTVVRGSLSDPRDGKSYKTVKIGNQTWMAENLNYNESSSVCYNNQDSYCATYGRLYRWEIAMTACPVGWHLPANANWEQLFRYIDGENDRRGDDVYRTNSSYVAGGYLKATNGWNNGGNGQDTYGFAALPGGEGSASGSRFEDVGNMGGWWTASKQDNNIFPYYQYMSSNTYNGATVDIQGGDPGRFHSVRCLQN